MNVCMDSQGDYLQHKSIFIFTIVMCEIIAISQAHAAIVLSGWWMGIIEIQLAPTV